jgi:hypothetical protein
MPRQQMTLTVAARKNPFPVAMDPIMAASPDAGRRRRNMSLIAELSQADAIACRIMTCVFVTPSAAPRAMSG